jgi:uncharacterized ParB-like nuclease family protein
MNILKDKPNLLFLIWVRNQNKNFLVVSKLRRPLYLVKMIKALTTIRVFAKECEVDGRTFAAGSKAYYLNGERHRVDGPAVIHHDGTKVYYLNGKCHRVDGPAIIYPDGYQSYYINGKNVDPF